MKPITLIGVVLIVLGALALAYQGISYTRTEKVREAAALGPHPAADAVARLDDGDTTTPTLEIARGGEAREPGAGD